MGHSLRSSCQILCGQRSEVTCPGSPGQPVAEPGRIMIKSVLAASWGSGEAWDSMNNVPSASIAAAQAILCFPRSRWRRKGAGTSPWQRSSSGQAGGGDGMVWRDRVGWGGGAWNPGGKWLSPSPWQGRSKFPSLPLAWGGLEATRGPLGGF